MHIMLPAWGVEIYISIYELSEVPNLVGQVGQVGQKLRSVRFLSISPFRSKGKNRTRRDNKKPLLGPPVLIKA
jgi:hypothetical protein